MPWRERFSSLSREERETMLPAGVPRVVIEAASAQGWEGIAGENGRVIGVDRFGICAPGATVMREFGFTADRIAVTALELTHRESRDSQKE